MTTIFIEDSTVQAKKFVDYLRTLPFVKIKTEEMEPEFDLYQSLDGAFADVRLMLDGKKREKTVEEFLGELDEL
jgi:hypothetical protein